MILLTGLFFVLQGQSDNNDDYKKWYAAGETIYSMETPTREDEDRAIEYYKKAEQALSKIRQNDSIWVDCLNKRGNLLQGQQRYKEAAREYYKAVAVNDQHLKNKRLEYESALYLGSNCYQSNIIDSARYFLERAAALADGDATLPELGLLYNSLGVIYYESANYKQAINYFQKSVHSTDSLGTEYTEMILSFRSNIATCLKLSGYTDSALIIYSNIINEALPYTETDQNIAQVLYKVYYNTAKCFLIKDQLDTALTLYLKMDSKQDQFTVKRMNDMGFIYMKMNEPVMADLYYDSAISLNNKISGAIQNKERATSYVNKSLLAASRGLIDEAISWSNFALEELHFDFKADTRYSLPTDEKKTISPILFFEVLQHKAEFFEARYKKTDDKKDAKASMDAYLLAIKTAHLIRQDFDNDEAHLFFGEYYKPVYKRAAKLAAHLSEIDSRIYTDVLLQVFESYKGVVLGNHLRNSQIKARVANAKALNEKEKNLKQLLSFYTNRLINLTNPADIEAMHQHITDLEVQLSRMQKEYERDLMFAYYKNQANITGLTLNSVQKNLSSEAAILNFMDCDSILLCMAITSTKVHLLKIAWMPEYNLLIDSIFNSAQQLKSGVRYNLHGVALFLYKKIFSDLPTYVTNKTDWYILADEKLHILPFESLESDQLKNTYLGLSRVLSYHYSLNLLMRPDNDDERRSLISFAPYHSTGLNDSNGYFPSLSASAQEVTKHGGYTLLGNTATKDSFLSLVSRYDIIHLATHASAFADSPSMTAVYFYPVKKESSSYQLSLGEIYNLDLKENNLVILSACETAVGQNMSGEGLLSLTRAFLYAGSRGIIATRWKTEDQVSSWIMQRLHYYLNKGKHPSTALFLAKRDFVNEETVPSYLKKPNYWANFVFVGQNNGDSKINLLLILLLLLFTLMLIFVVYRRMRIHQHH
jgi:CHAT domain-containing protein